MRFFYILHYIFLFVPFAAKAGIVEWHSSNIQILKGGGYKIGDRNRTIMTLEHAHGHAYGDTFAFIDWTWPHDGKPEYYAELSPRLSLSKIFDANLSAGIIKDILISTNMEKPKHQGPRYLYGGAIDLNLPGFKFFKTNAYIRDDTQIDGDTWQITLVWNRPFKVGNTNMLIEGFADLAGGEGPTKTSNQLIVPRFLIDAGNLAGYPNGKIWLGIEYSYWHNKFGNDGITESTPQLQLKGVF